jgi:oligopeptide/dipeptide ABC transporter ATP-binding protein
MENKPNKSIIYGLAALIAAVVLLAVCNVFFNLNMDPIHLPLKIPDEINRLGTDSSGRDILALLVRSTGISLYIGLGAAACAVFIGASAGCAAGYLRNPVDDLIMRLADIFLLIPTLPLIIVLSVYIGPGSFHVALVIGVTAWPATARVIYAHVLKLREQPFVVNAKSMGAGNFYLMARHILPNCTELLLAKGSLTVAGAMLAEAGVSFLGLGDPVRPSWGSMIHDAFAGAALINGYWWWYLPPVLCIAGSVVIFHSIGYLLSTTKHLGLSPVMPAVLLGENKTRPTNTFAAPIVAIGNLGITFKTTASRRPIPVIDELSLDLKPTEKAAIIGETGSGKSLLLLSILGLLAGEARVSGSIRVNGIDLSTMSSAQLRRHRGLFTGYVPQGLGQALNPVLKVGYQLAEKLHLHQKTDHKTALQTCIETLSKVGFSDPEKVMSVYPHHLSGGMKQRVLLAMAIINNPALLLADEPSKGLDPGAVHDIKSIFKSLESETILVVTHDLLFAKGFCDRVLVMQSGLVMEDAPARSFFDRPMHPYSKALVAALPSRGMMWDKFVQPRETPLKTLGCPYKRQCVTAFSRCNDCPPLGFQQDRRIRCWHGLS